MISATSFGSTQCTRERTSGDPKRVLRGGRTLRGDTFRASGSKRRRRSARTLTGIRYLSGRRRSAFHHPRSSRAAARRDEGRDPSDRPAGPRILVNASMPGLAAISEGVTPVSVRRSPCEFADRQAKCAPGGLGHDGRQVLGLRHTGGQIGERRLRQLDRVRSCS